MYKLEEKNAAHTTTKEGFHDENDGGVLLQQRRFLQFGEDEADAAYDVIGWGFVGGER